MSPGDVDSPARAGGTPKDNYCKQLGLKDEALNVVRRQSEEAGRESLLAGFHFRRRLEHTRRAGETGRARRKITSVKATAPELGGVPTGQKNRVQTHKPPIREASGPNCAGLTKRRFQLQTCVVT